MSCAAALKLQRIETMKRKIIFLICLCLSLSAAEKTIRSGPWEFRFDDRNGFWKSLSWNEEEILKNPHGIAPFNWGPGWPAGTCIQPDLFRYQQRGVPEWKTVQGKAPCVLEKYDWKNETKQLTLYYKVGEWRIRSEICFGVNGKADLVSNTLRMSSMPSEQTDQPALFSFVALNLPIGKTGRYLRPGTTEQPLTDLSKLGREIRLEEHWVRSPFSLYEYRKGRTLLLYLDNLKDLANFQLTGTKGACWIQANFASFGWAYPGEEQEIGPVYWSVKRNSLETAFRGGCWEMLEHLGLRVPSDRADWLKDAVLYCFYPMGNVNASRNLGGFNAAEMELIPRLKQLGFNTLWTMPVEETGIYNPRDYRKINPKLGTAEEYKALIHTAQKAGIRFLQDHVPHGGRPEYGPLRGNKPWDLTFDKNGNALHYWCFDYGSPSWREYVGRVVADLAREYGLDGFRVDVPDGSHVPNWRRKDFPNLSRVPKNVPADWWNKSLKENGGKLPPIPFQRASVTRRESGMLLLKTLRSNLKQVNPDGVLLAELTGFPYMLNCDFLYDKLIAEWVMRSLLPKMDTEELVRAYMNLKYQDYYMEPRGTFSMRYTDSHDTLSARGLVGIGMEQSFLATAFLMSGIPMVYQDADNGIGPFLKELIAARKEIPELRNGEDLYLESAVSSPVVFHLLRKDGENVSLALVNFSPRRQTVNVSVPRHLLPEALKGTVWRNGTELPLKTNGETVVFSIPLSAWGWDVAVFREMKRTTPEKTVVRKNGGKRLPVRILPVQNGWNISSGAYSLDLTKEGSLVNLKNAEGKVLVKNIVPVDRGSKMEVQREGSVFRVSKGKSAIVFDFRPDRILVTSKGESVMENLDAEQWCVMTSEGVLEDFYRPHPRFGVPGYNRNRKPEIVDPAEIWNSGFSIPDFRSPYIIWKTADAGVTLERRNFLKKESGTILLKNRVGKIDGCFTVLSGDHELILHPEIREKGEEIGCSLRKGALTLENQSREWEIRHPAWRAYVTRNGKLRALKDKNGKTLLRNFELQAFGGYGSDNGTATSGEDYDSRVKLYTENGKTVLEFNGLLRYPSAWGSIRHPALSYQIRYLFGEEPEIRVEYGWGCRGKKAPKTLPTYRFAMNPAETPVKTDGDVYRIGSLTIVPQTKWDRENAWRQVLFPLKKSVRFNGWNQENVRFQF